MLFSSLVFLFIFLPSVLLVYYISPKRLKNFVLLTFSLFFYGYGEPKSLLIMLLSILMNYIFGLLIDKYRENRSKSLLIMAFTVIGNLSVIGYYKYLGFAVENINALFNTAIPLQKILMPIGISFFTFQGMSYVIDVYRKHGKAQKNPMNVALYISLFPQLIAGPIVRYETVAEQIEHRNSNIDHFSYGIERFILGLGKKVLIANSMGLIADQVFAVNPTQMSIILAWIGVLAYTAQIYFDFSGYSDMAIGLGRMFGFEFLENFNYPYISKSITEFWRRWHISLSTWFRDYVYIPLGGNRVSQSKLIRNILLVWLLTGFWHGAAWNFIAWGLYFGMLLLLEKFLIGKYISRLWKPLQHLYALFFIVIGWVLFRSESLGYAVDYIGTMLGLKGLPFINRQAIFYLVEYRLELILSAVASIPIYPLLTEKLKSKKSQGLLIKLSYFLKYLFIMVIFLLCIMYLINSTFNPFIYFRF